MKTLVAALTLSAMVLFGGAAVAGDCHAPAAVVQTQAVVVAQPVAVVAAPVFVVPSTPTVAVQQVTVAQAVVAAPVVVAQPVVQQVVVKQKVVRPARPVLQLNSGRGAPRR